MLEPDEAVIYYYWLLPLTLLVVTITAEAIAVERKLLGQDQRTLLERLIKVMGSLTGSNRSLDAAFIEPLAPVLTPVEGQPLLDGKQRLIVSPHRLLHWYPFAAMPYQGEPLVRSFALRYAPNLTSLLVPRADPGAPRMAALAVSEFPGRPELGELHGSPQRSSGHHRHLFRGGHPLGADGRAHPWRGARRDARRHARQSVVPAPGHARAQPDGRDCPGTPHWNPCSNSPTIPSTATRSRPPTWNARSSC